MKKALTATTFLILSFAFAGSALATHPEAGQMEKVKYLAHDLYTRANYLYDRSARYTRYASYEEHEALEDLERLSEGAHHFYEQVGRYYREPRHTEADFRNLARAYRAASYSVHDLRTYRRYYREFQSLAATMDELAYYYGGADDGGRDYDRHRRGYDRDGRGYSGQGRRYSPPRYYPSKEEHIIRGAFHILKAITEN